MVYKKGKFNNKTILINYEVFDNGLICDRGKFLPLKDGLKRLNDLAKKVFQI